ncbi:MULTISPECIES: hypothetical protein [unclassified Pseudomonas]|uniref:hypothetical protein n=1 Tax=unclassified Pseudomonas TaxID=196821 RepID=UPI0024487AB4|nr:MULTISPECIES: hypothetical protein [unclassified Pseudomonas]MDG9923490.1 hypothetical protein [Pseudomonas sp. GD04045]MDH0035386.1 hypothetical protein [Pseudomonas sp. GD04019]
MKNHLLALALLASPSFAGTVEDFGPSIYAGMNARFDPAAESRYRQPETELRLLLAHQGANSATNHFCLLGYRWDYDLEFVSVHWREGQMILRWHGDRDWAEGFLSAVMSDGVDLQTGVIDAEDSRGSTFLVTRRNAEGTLEDCRRHGREYVIKPFTPPPSVEEE